MPNLLLEDGFNLLLEDGVSKLLLNADTYVEILDIPQINIETTDSLISTQPVVVTPNHITIVTNNHVISTGTTTTVDSTLITIIALELSFGIVYPDVLQLEITLHSHIALVNTTSLADSLLLTSNINTATPTGQPVLDGGFPLIHIALLEAIVVSDLNVFKATTINLPITLHNHIITVNRNIAYASLLYISINAHIVDVFVGNIMPILPESILLSIDIEQPYVITDYIFTHTTIDILGDDSCTHLFPLNEQDGTTNYTRDITGDWRMISNDSKTYEPAVFGNGLAYRVTGGGLYYNYTYLANTFTQVIRYKNIKLTGTTTLCGTYGTYYTTIINHDDNNRVGIRMSGVTTYSDTYLTNDVFYMIGFSYDWDTSTGRASVDESIVLTTSAPRYYIFELYPYHGDNNGILGVIDQYRIFNRVLYDEDLLIVLNEQKPILNVIHFSNSIELNIKLLDLDVVNAINNSDVISLTITNLEIPRTFVLPNSILLNVTPHYYLETILVDSLFINIKVVEPNYSGGLGELGGAVIIPPTFQAQSLYIPISVMYINQKEDTFIQAQRLTLSLTSLPIILWEQIYPTTLHVPINITSSIAQPFRDKRVSSINGIEFSKALYWSQNKFVDEYISELSNAVDGSNIISVFPLRKYSKNHIISTHKSMVLHKTVVDNLTSLVNTDSYVIIFTDGSYEDMIFDLLNNPFEIEPTYEGSDYYYVDMKVLI